MVKITRTYHKAYECYSQCRSWGVKAGRIRQSSHLCYGGHFSCLCGSRRHIQHRGMGVVHSHDSGQQLHWWNTVGISVCLHFPSQQRCWSNAASLRAISLRESDSVCSNQRTLGELLLGSVVPQCQPRLRSESAVALVRNALYKYEYEIVKNMRLCYR